MHLYCDYHKQIQRLKSNLKAENLIFLLKQELFHSVNPVKFYNQFELIYVYCYVYWNKNNYMDWSKTNNEKMCKDREMFACLFHSYLLFALFDSFDFDLLIRQKKEKKNIYAKTCKFHVLQNVEINGFCELVDIQHDIYFFCKN